MKKCPNCNQIFATDEAFCVHDGTPLITHFDGGDSFSGFSVSLEQPTQVVARPTHGQTIPPPFYPTPPPSNAVVSKNDAKWLYVVIGALAAVVLGMGGFFFLSRSADEKASNENTNWTQVNSSEENQSSVNLNSVAKTEPTAVRTPKPNNGVNNSIVNDMPIVPKSDPPPRFFSRNYYGTIASDGIEMRLTRNGSSLGGKVIPQDRYADISVGGSIDDQGNFTMNEYSDIGVVTGIYNGRISGTTISGSWSKPDGSRTRRLFLRSN